MSRFTVDIRYSIENDVILTVPSVSVVTSIGMCTVPLPVEGMAAFSALTSADDDAVSVPNSEPVDVHSLLPSPPISMPTREGASG